jgi:hypothetical protein
LKALSNLLTFVFLDVKGYTLVDTEEIGTSHEESNMAETRVATEGKSSPAQDAPTIPTMQKENEEQQCS